MTTPSTIPLSSISDAGRYRDAKKYGDLSGMKESIQSIGLIQPIVLSRNTDGSFNLVAGGRRFRSMQELGIKELYHASTLNPARLGFVFENEVPPHARLEAELDENLHRLEMDWVDNCLLIADVHAAKRAQNLKWGERQTATLLGEGYSLTKVNHAVRIAKLLRAGDKDIARCENFSGAIALLVKRKEDEALAEMQRRATEKVAGKSAAPSPLSPVSTPPSFLDSLADMPDLVVPKAVTIPTISLQEKPNESVEAVEIPLSQMFVCADSFRDVGDKPPYLSTVPTGSFHHIVTDIPYAIEMDNLTNVEDVAAQHDVQDNLSLMPTFLSEAFRLVRPGGFCVFFYDLDHHEKLQTLATDIGWRVQRWPYIACKTSSCRNNAPQYNTTKNFEVAMFLRRDETSVLRRPILSSWKPYDFASERALYNNPFAKPFELWKDIYDAIAFPGQSVLDPYCGEMSACRAAANCGLVPYGVELVPQHFNRGMEHMRAVYALIHKSNVKFT